MEPKLKQKSREDFLRLLTRFYGVALWLIASLGITYHLLHGSLTVSYFLFCFVVFVGGRFIQRTANQD